MEIRYCLLALAAALLLAGCGGGVEGPGSGGTAGGKGAASLSHEERAVEAPGGPADGRFFEGLPPGGESPGGAPVEAAGDPDCGGMPTGDPACGGAEAAVEDKDYMYPEGYNEDEMYRQDLRGPEDYQADYSGGGPGDEKYSGSPDEAAEAEDPEMFAPPTAEQDCEYLAPGDPDYCTKCGGC